MINFFKASEVSSGAETVRGGGPSGLSRARQSHTSVVLNFLSKHFRKNIKLHIKIDRSGQGSLTMFHFVSLGISNSVRI